MGNGPYLQSGTNVATSFGRNPSRRAPAGPAGEEMSIFNSFKINRIALLFIVAYVGFTLLAPAGALGENSLVLRNGLEIELYSPDDVLALTHRDDLGRLIFEVPGSTAYILIDDIDDPQITNKGDGAFHPMDVEWVLGALSSIGVSDADLDLGARVFVLPYPRSGFLSSTTCGGDIFLSPGVVEFSIGSVAMIATHELAHVFQRRHAPEEENESWSAYLEIRGITDESIYCSDAEHMNRPVEIFAEDFRYLFGGTEACLSGAIENPDLPLPGAVPGLEDFFVSLVAPERIVASVSPEPLGCSVSNYPNPFNPSTIVRVVLSDAALFESEDVSLAVYRVDGSLVRELHSGAVSGNDLSVPWDGTDRRGAPVASGVYLCRARAGRYAATGKLLLIR